MRPKRRTLLFACALCAASGSASARAEWPRDVDLRAIHDENVNRAYEALDIRADGAVTLRAAVGQHFALSPSDDLSLTAAATGVTYRRHSANLVYAWRY